MCVYVCVCLSLFCSRSRARISGYWRLSFPRARRKIPLAYRVERYNSRTARERVLPDSDILGDILRSFNSSRTRRTNESIVRCPSCRRSILEVLTIASSNVRVTRSKRIFPQCVAYVCMHACVCVCVERVRLSRMKGKAA